MNIYDILSVSQNDIEKLLLDKENQYLSYPIAKRHGKATRWIDAPQEELKGVQETILNKLLYRYMVHPNCVGFVRGKNVTDGARQHLGSVQLLNMDLKNFFGTINQGRVSKLLTFLFTRYKKIIDAKFKFTAHDVRLIAELVTFKGRVPQGAPTSPAISNLCCNNLDRALTELARKNKCLYTRYADDMSFSTQQSSKQFDIGKLIKQVIAFVEKEQFKVNYKKTRIQRQHNRMTVTGVVVNEKLSTPKWYWRNFRAKLHNLVVGQIPVNYEEYQEIRGVAEWIKMLHPTRGEKFLSMIGKLNLAF